MLNITRELRKNVTITGAMPTARRPLVPLHLKGNLKRSPLARSVSICGTIISEFMLKILMKCMLIVYFIPSKI